MSDAAKYFRFIKFSHTLFALPFALIGYFLATKYVQVKPEWILFFLVIACMVFARNAAMGFNRWLDADIDKKNPRTAGREIPQGTISKRNALIFIVVNVVLFIASTWFINLLCFLLSPVALIVILGYSYTKRFTALCHFVLGTGLSLAPIGAWLAVTGYFDILPLLFSFAVLSWVSGFDIVYALQDDSFDASQKLKSVPVALGRNRAILLSILLHLVSIICIIIAGIMMKAGLLFWLGSLVFSGLLVYQHLLVKPGDLSKVNLAFATMNGIGSVVFAAFTISDLYFRIIFW